MNRYNLKIINGKPFVWNDDYSEVWTWGNEPKEGYSFNNSIDPIYED